MTSSASTIKLAICHTLLPPLINPVLTWFFCLFQVSIAMGNDLHGCCRLDQVGHFRMQAALLPSLFWLVGVHSGFQCQWWILGMSWEYHYNFKGQVFISDTFKAYSNFCCLVGYPDQDGKVQGRQGNRYYNPFRPFALLRCRSGFSRFRFGDLVSGPPPFGHWS